jgi:cell division protein ZapA (FtsZ GTPase activity inhibitor)
MDGEQIRVHLLGTSFTIRTTEDPEYFTSLIRYVENKYEEIRRNMGISDPLRIAIISSILVSDELFKTSADSSQVETMTNEMIELIDKNLKENT